MECFTQRGEIILRKRGYDTRRQATAALHRTLQRFERDPDNYNVYRCRVCRKYHFGRKSRRLAEATADA